MTESGSKVMAIDKPWKMDEPPAQYQAPIVEHKVAIKFARQEISIRRKQDSFHEQSCEVNQKLGSRQKMISRKKTSKKTNSNQLSFDFEGEIKK